MTSFLDFSQSIYISGMMISSWNKKLITNKTYESKNCNIQIADDIEERISLPWAWSCDLCDTKYSKL